MKYLLSEIAKICGGELRGTDRCVENLLTDSRRSVRGEQTLFVAMRGQNHNSHNFIGDMLRRGIEAFMVEEEPPKEITRGSYVVVKNSIVALQRLASHHRSTFRGKVVAVVGSNGKTVVKEWAAQLYSGEGKLFRSPRSYNSQLGVAISLLVASGDEEVVLLEAGISRTGEMERLEAMIRPEVVVVTSIGDAHSAGFGSLEQKIEEKMKIAQGAQRVIYHSAYALLKSYFEGHKPSFELIDAANYSGAGFTNLIEQRNSQVVEALMAECGCLNPDFESLSPVAMRLEVKEGLGGSVVVNDSYNSCVNSLSIALDTLCSVAAGRPTTLVLSPILQSGTPPEELYREVSEVIRAAKIERVIGVGGAINRWIDCTYFGSTEELLAKISHEDYSGRAILLKGNRTSRFERLSHHLERKSHTTRLEVDLDAMVSNLNFFRSRLTPQTKLIAMVKASSYGAGDYEIAQTLQEQGVDYLAVAFVDEGVELRERGITMPIIVLNADDDSFSPMIHFRLEPEIYSLGSLCHFIEAVERNGESHYPIHLKVDSGMHRLGFDEGQTDELCEQLSLNCNTVRVASIFSHLSSADEPEGEQNTEKQIALFDKISSRITASLGYSPMRHVANSAAIERFPSAHFDGCRLGIGLYGFGTCEQELTPVATLKSRIVQIKSYGAHTSIGYGGAQTLERESLVATVPIGYADGLRRDLGCGGWSMLLGEHKAPIVGRICMDSVMIDVSDCPEAREGCDVTIFSPVSGNKASDMAKILGTIPYEILTSISKRVKRVYLKE